MAAALLGGIDLPRHPRAAILTALTSTTRKAKARNPGRPPGWLSGPES